jgi:hypothetical protein
VEAQGGAAFTITCGWNTAQGRLRHNASIPLANLIVSRSGLLTVEPRSSPSVTLRSADVSDVVPMDGSSWNPLKSTGLAVHRVTGEWDYIWCGAASRDAAASELLAAGFPVRERRGGVWPWQVVVGQGRAPL